MRLAALAGPSGLHSVHRGGVPDMALRGHGWWAGERSRALLSSLTAGRLVLASALDSTTLCEAREARWSSRTECLVTCFEAWGYTWTCNCLVAVETGRLARSHYMTPERGAVTGVCIAWYCGRDQNQLRERVSWHRLRSLMGTVSTLTRLVMVVMGF